MTVTFIGPIAGPKCDTGGNGAQSEYIIVMVLVISNLYDATSEQTYQRCSNMSVTKRCSKLAIKDPS